MYETCMPDISSEYRATCPLECFVVACARPRGTRTAQRGAPAPMAEGRAEAEEWLGAEVGGVKLAEKTEHTILPFSRRCSQADESTCTSGFTKMAS